MTKKRQFRKVGTAGSFQNQMMGNNATEPTVGKGATILHYSDRTAYEVIAVENDGKACTIRAMDAKNIGECYGDERYQYASDPNGEIKKLEWNAKKQQWGEVYTTVEIIKALAKKLEKVYGWGWTDYLPVKYKDLIDGENEGVYTKLKLVDGITKEYKNFHPVSVIFGVMEQYRDPHF